MLTPTATDAIACANASGRRPVVFIHGLWLKAASWGPWTRAFEGVGYAALAPGWPSDEGQPVVESLGQVVDHYARIVQALDRRPVLIGHSFGGLIAQILAGRGLAEATVAISPAPFRGVLPLPLSALRSAWPVLGNPANAHRQVPLTPEQFRFAFGNALTGNESDALYEAHYQPAPGRPVFQAAMANINPWTEARVATRAAERGPLLLVSADQDHTVPPSVVGAAYGLQKRNRAWPTERVRISGRGHSLTIDDGWQGPAEASLTFIKRFAAP